MTRSIVDPPITSELVAKHGLTPEEFERVIEMITLAEATRRSMAQKSRLHF